MRIATREEPEDLGLADDGEKFVTPMYADLPQSGPRGPYKKKASNA